MKIYIIKFDGAYQGVRSVSRANEADFVRLSIQPLASFVDFKFKPFYVDSLKEKRGNFFGLTSSALLFDSVAEDALGDIVSLAGESYKLDVKKLGQLTFLNTIETCQEALDRDKTRFRHDDGIKKTSPFDLVFKPEKIRTKTGLFRIPDDRYSQQYIVTDSPHQELDFYKIYHDSQLTGLKFEKIWESS